MQVSQVIPAEVAAKPQKLTWTWEVLSSEQRSKWVLSSVVLVGHAPGGGGHVGFLECSFSHLLTSDLFLWLVLSANFDLLYPMVAKWILCLLSFPRKLHTKKQKQKENLQAIYISFPESKVKHLWRQIYTKEPSLGLISFPQSGSPHLSQGEPLL